MIGWYVHHHGRGHLHRFRAVAPHLAGPVTALSSLPPPDGDTPWVELPLDVPGGADPTAGGVLHWAPLGCDGLRERTARIAAWVAEHQPRVLVVDVSVEVALLARLLAVPTVVVAQRGDRTDPPHRLARATARAIAAPWSQAVAPFPGAEHVGAISRFDGRPTAAPATDDVLLLVGGGGDDLDAGEVAAAAASTGRTWHVAGALRVDAPGVVDHGADADVWALLQRCAIVVATAGGNTIAEVAAARRPLVLLPQERPFGEQRAQAAALSGCGLAEVAVPWPPDWPAVLARAEARGGERWALLHDGHGARRLAAVVERVACA